VKHCLDFVKEAPKTGRLEPIIALAREGKHTAVAGFSPSSGNEPWTGDFAGLQFITATLDVADGVTLDARGETKSETAAEAMATRLTGYRDSAMIPLAIMAFGGRKDHADAATALLSVLKRVRIQPRGRDVLVTASLEDGGVAAEALLTLPKLLER
jgi:hypothetical protein